MTDEIKAPPNDFHAETSILGCCLLDKGARIEVQSIITRSDFFHPPHAIIYDAINAVTDSGKIPDVLTVSSKLMARKDLEAAGGGEYLAGLTNTVPSARNAEHYSKIVRDHSLRRQLSRLGNELSKNALHSGNMTPTDLSTMALTRLSEIGHDGETDRALTLEQTFEESDTYAAQVKAKERMGVLDLGYKSLEEKCGLEPGDVCLIGGYTSTGKTTLAVNFAKNVAASGGHILFLSLEMTRRQIDHKFAALITEKPGRLFKYGAFYTEDDSADHKASYRKQLSVIGSRILIKHCPYATIEEIRRTVKHELIENPQICLVVVDYIQLIELESTRYHTNNERVGKISRSLKHLATECEIPVIALSQLSRGEKTDINRCPRLSDLRDSGALEQDADVVILLHLTTNKDDDKHLLEKEWKIDAIVAKGRTEGTGMAAFVMIRDIGLFTDNPEAIIYDD